MRIKELFEGGWDTTKTQSTELTPAVVRVALGVVDQFVKDFNNYTNSQGIPPIQRGKPTGSTAYYEQDEVEKPDNIYGDIDLQMIAPIKENETNAQFTSYWNDLTDQFAKSGQVNYIDTSESKPGHPIIQVGRDQYVQVDFMWHPGKLAKWGAARVTPERGVKGMLFGNMFSVFGELLDMSIQHAGVQLKVIDDQRVPFSKQKGTQLITVTIEPETFVLDTFKYLAKRMGINNPKIDPLLSKFPGNNINDVKIVTLVNSVKGFAASAQANGMFGKNDLSNFSSGQDFLNKFLQRYEEKAMIDVQGKKRDKATTPEAQARAEADKQKILSGLEMVKGLF